MKLLGRNGFTKPSSKQHRLLCCWWRLPMMCMIVVFIIKVNNRNPNSTHAYSVPEHVFFRKTTLELRQQLPTIQITNQSKKYSKTRYCSSIILNNRVVNSLLYESSQSSPSSTSTNNDVNTTTTATTPSDKEVVVSTTPAQMEAKRLLDRARQLREEIAAATGTTVLELEQEVQAKRQRQNEIETTRVSRQKAEKDEADNQRRSGRKYILPIPETYDEQIEQAKHAVERAYKDGITRQIVRFTLMIPPSDKLGVPSKLKDPERDQWPGGAQQIYRMAAGPMTTDLLRQLRTRNNNSQQQQPQDDTNYEFVRKQPVIETQTIWDFDGTALITAKAHDGAQNDIQALVLPNTDNKYTTDIETISDALGNDRLFILINPFWKDISSWGYNILQPNAKKHAQRVLFNTDDSASNNTNFQETYCLIQTSVRGEDCVAIKAYPYDWQLYAYYEEMTGYYPNNIIETLVYLGSIPAQQIGGPSSADFAMLLNDRDEFKMSKNMRALQRMIPKE